MFLVNIFGSTFKSYKMSPKFLKKILFDNLFLRYLKIAYDPICYYMKPSMGFQKLAWPSDYDFTKLVP